MAIKFDTFTTAGGGASSLDDVTTVGATTTNSITVGGVTIGTEYTLPSTDGSPDQYLKTDGAGALSFASLDITGGLVYQGSYDASINTPALTNAEQGDFYIVSAAGTQFGKSWSIGDHLLVNADMGGSIDNSKIDKIDNTETTATEDVAGVIEIATNAEAGAGTATNKALVPSNISSLDLSSMNNTTSGFIADITGENLGELSDVTITSATSGEVLKYDGASWVDAQLAYSDLSGTPSLATVATTGAYSDLTGTPSLATVATTGAYSDLSGTPTNVSTFTNDAGYLTDITGENLGELSDVTITSVTSGQVLSYNGSAWVNAAAAGGASALDDLTDVTITAAATGEVLRYNGSAWVDAQLDYSDLSGTAPTPFTVTNTAATSYTASANEIINHTGSGSGAAVITMPSSAVSGDVVIIRKTTGQGTMITINDPGGSKIQDVNIFPYTGNVMVTYDGTNWIAPRTNYDFQRSTSTAFTLYGYWFGRFVIFADGSDGNTFTVNIQVSATSLLEGARQLILCRGARDLVITSPSSDIVDPTDGNTTDTLVNSVTVPAHGGIVELWVNGQGQYVISAPLANLSTVATTGAYSDLSGTPSLATVATTGAYSDLTGAPTTVSTFTNDSGYLTDITGESISDLSDVTITSATSGQVLSYNGSVWVNSASSGGASALDDLTDVTITSAASGEVLRYNGSSWVDAQLAYSDLSGTPTLATVATTGAYSDLTGTPTNVSTFTNDSGYLTDITGESISDLSDVSITSATSGQVLSYNGSAWVNAAAAGGGGWTYSAITADPANAQTGYHYSCTGTFTITLPTSGVNSGEEIRIKNMGTGSITVDPGTQNIDGSTTDYVLDVQFSAITLVSTGAHWEII